MSRFVEQLVASATARGHLRGIVTGEPSHPVSQTWAQVHDRARRIAGALLSGGLRRGATVGLLVAAPSQICPAVQAVWMSGGSVTMLHQPNPRTDFQKWTQDTVSLLLMIKADLVLLGKPFEVLAPILSERGIRCRIIGELDGAAIAAPVAAAEDDLALLQLTSGTTGKPKAVMITHQNLMSNLTAAAERSEFDVDNDVMVSWLPTFHDMGMNGFLTSPMLFGMELVNIHPLEFLSNPLVWMDTLTKYRGTITSAPSFAYAMLAARLATVTDDRAFDLSSVRIAMNGAEPIDPVGVTAFTDAAKRFGLDPCSIVAANGMAEATVAASFEIGRGLETDTVEAHSLESGGRLIPVPAQDPRQGSHQVRVLARLGRPVRGLEVRIVGDDGAVLTERMVGEIQLRGDSISPGYLTLDGPVSTRDAQGWFATGDLGYLVDGQIVVCGRRKDVLVRADRRIFPTDVERIVTGVDGVRAGNAVAVRIDPDTDRERFAVVLESRLAGDGSAERALAREVTERVAAAIDATPVSVIVMPPGSLPKTTSGKLRRLAAASRFVAHLNQPEATV
jgi:fatty-acyl-CoA synthase